MLKSQDLLVTLKLASLPTGEVLTFAATAQALSMSVSEVFAATKRAVTCHLLVVQSSHGTRVVRYRPLGPNLRDFLISGLRYVFPAEPGRAVRGFPTAQDAPPLALLMTRPPAELPLVWPHSDGDTRGQSIKPIFRSAPEAAQRDHRLYEWLALVDALRTGDSRVRTLAGAEVSKLISELDYARI